MSKTLEDETRLFVTLLLVFGEMFFILSLLMGWVKALDPGFREVVLILIGAWTTKTITAVSFYFGSSSGSDKKTDKLIERANDSDVETDPEIHAPVMKSGRYEGDNIGDIINDDFLNDIESKLL